MSELVTVASVSKTIHVGCTPEDAFRLFTREIGSWWPTERIALHPGEVREVVFEERACGEVYEVSTGGEKALWATVVAFEPPVRLVLTWHVQKEPTEIEVLFAPEGDGARVELEHRNWERLGEDAATTRGSYDSGWDTVLAPYVERLSS